MSKKVKLTKKNIVTVIIIFVLLCLSTYGAYTIVKNIRTAYEPINWSVEMSNSEESSK